MSNEVLYNVVNRKFILTDFGLKQLVQDYGLGYSQQKIAKKFNVGEDTIRRWMKENNISTRKRKWNIQEDYFDLIDSPEKAYWLGFLGADGYVHQERGEIQFELQESDKSQVQKLADALSCNKPLLEINGQFHDKSYTHWRFVIKCRHMVDTLQKYGITQRKSLTFYPKNIPQSLFDYWIIGYMDGDGCIFDTKGRIKISFTGTMTTLTMIKDHFHSSNAIRLEHNCKNTYKFTLEVDKSENFLKSIKYDTLPFVLERKQKHYCSII